MLKTGIKLILRGGYCQEARAYFAAAGTLSSNRKHLIDQLIRSLKTSGIWDKLDAYWLLANETSLASRVNLVNPGTNTLSITSSPTFTADRGWVAATPGTDGLSTGIDFTSGTWKYVRDSAHMAIWSTTNVANGGSRSYDIGGIGATWRGYLARSVVTSTRVVAACNCNSVAETANGYYPGHVLWSRTASNAWATYAQGVSTETGSDASVALDSVTNGILYAQGIGGGANTLTLAHMGSQLSAIDAANDYTIANTYMKAIGAA